MQYGSIGWSVGALLGYQKALEGKKRVLAFIGDGSFQVTAQVGPRLVASSPPHTLYEHGAADMEPLSAGSWQGNVHTCQSWPAILCNGRCRGRSIIAWNWDVMCGLIGLRLGRGHAWPHTLSVQPI